MTPILRGGNTLTKKIRRYNIPMAQFLALAMKKKKRTFSHGNILRKIAKYALTDGLTNNFKLKFKLKFKPSALFHRETNK